MYKQIGHKLPIESNEPSVAGKTHRLDRFDEHGHCVYDPISTYVILCYTWYRYSERSVHCVVSTIVDPTPVP